MPVQTDTLLPAPLDGSSVFDTTKNLGAKSNVKNNKVPIRFSAKDFIDYPIIVKMCA